MSVIRCVKNDRYYVADRYAVEDGDLSYKAVGIHQYVMSRPDGWVVRMTDLVNRHTDGRDAVQSGIRELIDAGYARYHTPRRDDGTLKGKELQVREHPDVPWPDEDRKPENPFLGDRPKDGFSEDRENRRSENPKIGKSDPNNNQGTSTEPEVEKNDHHNPPAQAGEDDGGGSEDEKNISGRDQRLAALVEEGVSERNARQLVEEHPWKDIYLQLLHYRFKQERGGEYAPDGPGWIVGAVREGYDLPPAVRRQASKQLATVSDPNRSPSASSGGDSAGGGPPPDQNESGGDGDEPADEPAGSASEEDDVPSEPPDLDLDEICGITPGTTRLSPDYRSTHQPND